DLGGALHHVTRAPTPAIHDGVRLVPSCASPKAKTEAEGVRRAPSSPRAKATTARPTPRAPAVSSAKPSPGFRASTLARPASRASRTGASLTTARGGASL